jgi:hypothetical protein
MTRISDTPAPHGTPRKPGIPPNFTGDLGSVIDLPPEALISAVRGVASRARDAADARLLLDVLGLLPTPAKESP